MSIKNKLLRTARELYEGNGGGPCQCGDMGAGVGWRFMRSDGLPVHEGDGNELCRRCKGKRPTYRIRFADNSLLDAL